MGEAKFQFFKHMSIIFFSITFVSLAYHVFITRASIPWKNLWKHLSITDYFIIVYAILVWISFLLTPYKKDAIWGYEGWYMGLISQMIFVMIYFLVSRFLEWKMFILHGSSIVSGIVFLLAILHRFQIDPLGMYDNLSMTNKILFLSTLGQATWYSSYMVIVLPLGIIAYWSAKRIEVRIAYGIYLVLGFASLVTQNSDSAFIALGLMIFTLFLVSLKATEKMERFLEIAMIMLITFKIIGLLQKTYPEKVVPLEPLSIAASQGVGTWILLLVVLCAYLLLRFPDEKKPFRVIGNRILPKILVVLALLAVPVTLIMVYLTTTQQLPTVLQPLSSIGYLNFNNDWGNGRGFTWKYAAAMFMEYSPLRKLFGCGPDCFAAYSYELHSAELTAKWGDSILTNAHNEWFTSLLFFGFAGVVAYGGIFISTVVTALKNIDKEPFLIAVVMSVLAYMGHNFFCYQQVVCTPIIFILMGFGRSIIIKIEKAGK
ncbi:MAG: O-antigen ligase family protein [Lachnospiraceae bacterium]|nr:O-antigen ligase family protein [Lachnospiraceae bacterium]